MTRIGPQQRGWNAALLLVLLPRPCSAAGGGDAWYAYEYEYNFFEDFLLILFVAVALAFETVWHGLGHVAHDSYRYGKYHVEAQNGFGWAAHDHGNTQHPQLYKELYNRMGAEFMTLGLLAFLIFAFNQAGGFSSLANAFKPCVGDCFHHPVTNDDWLHLAEIVHVKLFLGMLLYYSLIYFLVRGSVEQIRKWEKLRLRRSQAESSSTAAIPRRSLDRDLQKHMLWRDYFIENVLRLRRNRPETFRQMMEKCSINPDAPNAEAQLRQCFDERFSLSAYLALNLESGVMDSIEVHKPTWGVLMVCFGFFALMHYQVHMTLRSLVPVFISIAFAIFTVMWWFSKESQAKIKRYIKRCRTANERDRELERQEASQSSAYRSTAESVLGPNEAKVNIHERWNTETLMLRTLQVFLFLIAYVFAQTLLDLNDWESDAELQILNCLAFTVLCLVLARFLPLMVPIFVAVMAFPPYVDEANLAAVFHVLLDDYRQPDKALCTDRPMLLAGASRSSQEDGETTTAEASCNNLEAVRELAELMGVSEQLERRLRDRETTRSQDFAGVTPNQTVMI